MFNSNRNCAISGSKDDFQYSFMTSPQHHGNIMVWRSHPGKLNSCQERLLDDFQEYLEHDKLDVCYQPLVDLSQGKTTGVEALLRWQHPLYGAVSPDIFIPLAEQAGAIHTLTFRILNHALRQLHIWEADGISIEMAVNLSMVNLHDENFPLQVKQLLEQWAITPARLILEVTEGVIMYDPEQATRILKQLDGLGVKLALDDFGAGYSSLSHLARLPIRELKIDRSLIGGIDNNEKNAVIVRSTIELAQKLGMKIVAEGVENIVVLKMLNDYGCNNAQGFLFSKPVNQAEFKSWYLNRRDRKNNLCPVAGKFLLQPDLGA